MLEKFRRPSLWILFIVGMTLGPLTACDDGDVAGTAADPLAHEASGGGVIVDGGAVDGAVVLPAQYDSLHDLMEDMERHYKFLKRNAEAGSASDLLARTAAIRELAERAKAMTPEQVTDAALDQRDVLARAYQSHLDEIAPAVDVIEAAIRDDDRSALSAAIYELHETEERGHHSLGVDDDH